MVISSDEEPAPREAIVQETSLSEEPDRLSTERDPQPSAGPRNELPSIEQQKQPVSVNSSTSSSQITSPIMFKCPQVTAAMGRRISRVIQISPALEAEDTRSGTGDPDDEHARRAREKVLRKVTPEKCKCYQLVYDYLKEQAPYFVDLIKQKRSGETELLMREVSHW
ncbi:hypothetical protein PISMIDRAFT_25831 [Pisolithus microcarpus 441]|uniref:Uncharacterized protein n=1 Tax=Pisolithus microcarpus 441 TaxID=765257 RepID=A0A0C9YAW2_9AGAM|nr:hypothetical protein PISMIDRAFT_25831 [Pisolithus microcarpus 441]